MIIKALEKNKRICITCNATYVINGDPSGYWYQYPTKNIKSEGLCEFCRPTGKFSLSK